MKLETLFEKRKFLQQQKEVLLLEKGIKPNNEIIMLDRFKIFSSDVIADNSIESKNEMRIKNYRLVLSYIKNKVINKEPINENMVKDIHEILMQNQSLECGGIYRNSDVSISGTDYIPPSPSTAYQEIKYFYHQLKQMSLEKDAIEVAAFSLVDFVRIHPFFDGNGRTSRTLMNYVLLCSDFYPVIIDKSSRSEYLDRLDSCISKKTNKPMEEMVYKLQDTRLEYEIKKCCCKKEV